MPEIIFRFVFAYGVRVVVGLRSFRPDWKGFLAVRHGEAYAEYRQIRAIRYRVAHVPSDPRGRRFVCVLITASFAVAQTSYPTRLTEPLVQRPAVQEALAYVDRNFERQVAEWIRVTEIPAPSGQEAARAAHVRAELEKLGLKTTTDTIGNVTARRAGTGGGPTIVFAAHMDTVFPVGTDITVKRAPDGTFHAPGVFDNTASVINMLQAARAMDAAQLRTRGT